jgi:glucan biosynthesis protein C
MTTPHAGGRLHAFDALRAAMMLLGIVLHTAVSYTVTPLREAWPYQDASRNVIFDFTAFIIHLFRMPTFFVMAGFFAALLYQREHGSGFISHRVRRLLLPMLAAWVVLSPIVRGAFAYAETGGGTAGWPAAVHVLRTDPYGFASGDANMMHLWFIYYLLMLSILGAISAWIARRLPEQVRATTMDRFAAVVSSGWGVLVLSAISTLTLIPMQVPGLDTPFSMIPAPRIVFAYGVFFAFGWLLHARKELIARFGTHPWRYLLAGLVVSLVYMTIVLAPVTGDPRVRHLQAIAAAALAMWLLIYGITGLFVRYFHAPRPIQRYLSDGAYWMYLIHLPFAIGFAGVLSPVALPAVVKFSLVVGATALVTIASYYAFVRSTAIGHFLNGRKYERAIPVPSP